MWIFLFEHKKSPLGIIRRMCRRRHRIEHLELPGPRDLDRMESLGLLASMQPNFVGQWGHEGGLYEQRLGRTRVMQMNPFLTILDRKIPLSFGSDIMPLSPMYGIISAMNHPVPTERLTFDQALETYTRSVAYSAYDEDVYGTIRPEAPADIVLLSGNPNKATLERNLQVELTLIDGDIVYSSETIHIGS